MKTKNFQKFIFVFSLLAVTSLTFGTDIPTAKAMTAAEIQVLITSLQDQITDLQKRLSGIADEEASWCHNFNRNLKYGNNGNEVKALQRALYEEGFSPLPYKKEDKNYGNFEEYTASAVVGFQEKYKKEILTPWRLNHGTGFVGSTTRKKLNELYGCDIEKPKKPEKKSITIISPNGGEVWEAGNTYEIKWVSSKEVDKVDIYLYKSGSQYGSALAWAISSPLGKYSYPLTTSPPTGDEWQIRIVDSDNSSVFDESNNYFSIVKPVVIKQGCPDVNADGKVNVLDQQILGWSLGKCSGDKDYNSKADITGDNCVNQDDLDILTKHFLQSTTCSQLNVCPDVNADGKVNVLDQQILGWSLGKCSGDKDYNSKADITGDNCVNNGDIIALQQYLGRSSSEIPQCRSKKSITIISPNGGEVWEAGNTYEIKWVSSKEVDKVDIYLYKSGSQYGSALAWAISSPLGKYSYPLTTSPPTGDEWQIRIVDSDNSSVFDESDNYFSIVNKLILSHDSL